MADISNKKIRIGTRASKLAMGQSNWVKSELEKNSVTVELIQIKTEGDTATGPLAQIGGQGLFTKRLQIALLENEIDLAVHSLKDLPTEDHDDLTIAAIPQREDTADAFVSNKFSDVDSLPAGATVGTGSVRRAAQILHRRDDLKIEDIRGNVDTRLKKLDDGNYDAIILACAGLKRLGLGDRITQSFTPDVLMPAVGQGALGLEIRKNDSAAKASIEKLNHLESYHRAMAERMMLRTLFAGCLAPVGANTWVESGVLTLEGIVLSKDGKDKVQFSAYDDLAKSLLIGKQVAEQLIEKGASEFLK